MIEINLLPGAKKSKRSAGISFDFRGFFGDFANRVRDPWLLTAIGGVVLGVSATAFLYWRTSSREADLLERETVAVQDSTRYALVIKERNTAEAQRDSVVRQIAIISAIDGSRYVWPHVMSELSRALPPYTWLRSVQQTSAVPAVPPEVEVGVSSKSAGKAPAARQAELDEAAAAAVVTVRLIGQSVDVQAITRYVRLLEDSPWFDNVTLVRTEDVLAQPSNKEVKEFMVDMRISKADSSFIRRVPLTVGVR